MTRAHGRADAPTQDEVLDAVLAATRVLVAIAARSLAASTADVTLPQYRTLVILAYDGAQRTVDLAEQLDVNSSTATRMIDRLVQRHLVRRDIHPEDRRANRVEISDDGRAVVAAVTARRRQEFGKILRKIDPGARQCLVEGLEAMRDAAGEAPEHGWRSGWGQ